MAFAVCCDTPEAIGKWWIVARGKSWRGQVAIWVEGETLSTALRVTAILLIASINAILEMVTPPLSTYTSAVVKTPKFSCKTLFR